MPPRNVLGAHTPTWGREWIPSWRSNKSSTALISCTIDGAFGYSTATTLLGSGRLVPPAFCFVESNPNVRVPPRYGRFRSVERAYNLVSFPLFIVPSFLLFPFLFCRVTKKQAYLWWASRCWRRVAPFVPPRTSTPTQHGNRVSFMATTYRLDLTEKTGLRLPSPIIAHHTTSLAWIKTYVQSTT